MKTEKTSLRGKTHFDVSSSLWTPTMMNHYIHFQEGYNRGPRKLSVDSLMKFAWLHEGCKKQQDKFVKVYNKYHKHSA